MKRLAQWIADIRQLPALVADASRLLLRGRLQLFPWLFLIPWALHAAFSLVPRPSIMQAVNNPAMDNILSAEQMAESIVSFGIFTLADAMAILHLAGLMQDAPIAARSAWRILRKRIPPVLIGTSAARLAVISLSLLMFAAVYPVASGLLPARVEYWWARCLPWLEFFVRVAGIYIAARLAFVVPLVVLEDVRSLASLRKSWLRTHLHRTVLFLLFFAAFEIERLPYRIENQLITPFSPDNVPLSAWLLNQLAMVVFAPTLHALTLAAMLIIFWQSHSHRERVSLSDSGAPPLPREESLAAVPNNVPPYPLSEFGSSTDDAAAI